MVFHIAPSLIYGTFIFGKNSVPAGASRCQSVIKYNKSSKKLPDLTTIIYGIYNI